MDRLPNPETPGPARTHHQGQQQRGRHCPRSLLRLRHRLHRRRPAGARWVGIDISPKAVELVNMRLQQSMGSLFHHGYVTARTDIPRRTDIEAPMVPIARTSTSSSASRKGSATAARATSRSSCSNVDHRVPRSRGGTDHLDNLQLLCSSCNRIKGDRPHEYLVARLAEIAV